MMLTPYVFAKSMFDEVFDSAFETRHTSGMMNTDIKETENAYELIIDLPGIHREDLSAELKNGYLIVSASAGQKGEEEAEPSGRYLRRERLVGTFKRSFYVGNQIRQEDIKAKYDQGVLYLTVPKAPSTPRVEQRNLIDIEG